MKVLRGFLALMVLAVGCTTLVQRPPVSIELAAVEELQIGKSTETEVRKRFGEPERVIAFETDADTWIYYDHFAKEPYQRASFVFDREKRVLLTSTWIPNSRDALGSKEAVLGHFKNASFKVKDIGWIAKHEYSNEAIYSDAALGVSIRLNKVTHHIVAVSLDRAESPPLVL